MSHGRVALDRMNTRIAEVLLLVIAILGIAYLGDRVIGASVFSSSHEVTVELTSGGGIYPGADVTYRGVSVGRVSTVELTDSGVRARVRLEGDTDVPVDTVAAVSNLSAIGEQRIDFRPRSTGGPYLRDGSVVAAADTTTPMRFDQLIVHLGDVAERIDPDDVRTITSELGAALDTDTDLLTVGRNAERTLQLLSDLQPRLHDLMLQSQAPLRTVTEQGDDLRSFARDLDLVTATLGEHDPVLRRTLDSTEALSPVLADALDRLTPPLTATIRDWNTFAEVGDDRLAGYSHWLEWAGPSFAGFGDAVRDGTGHVLMVPNFGDLCQYGPLRSTPYATTHTPADPDRRCSRTEPDLQQRGAQYAPRLPGDPTP